MKKTFIILFLSLVMLLSVTLGLAAEEYELYFDLQEGQAYNLVMEMTNKMSQEIMGQSLEMEQYISAKYEYAIKEISDEGIYKIDITMMDMGFDFTKFEITGSEEDIDIDSLNAEMDYLNDMIINRTLKMEMDRYGNVESIEGIDEYMMDMYEYLMENENDPEAVTAYQNLATQFNDEFMKQSFEGYNAFMPDGLVTIGETWTREMELPQELPIVMAIDYTLDEVTEDEFIIKFTGDLGDIGDLMSLFGLADIDMDIDIDLDTRYSGEIRLDRNSRWYNSMEIIMTMDGNFTMLIPVDEEGNPQEFQIPVNVINETIINS